MILIAGANGFLGSEICNKLKKRKIKFLRLDISLKGIEKVDINNINDLEKLFNKKKIKTIINCACEPATSKSKNEIIKTNKSGNLNLIKLALKYKVNKFIFFSTSAIFVKNYKKPLNENAKPNPVETYGLSKVLAEKDIINSNLKSWTIFRIPMIVSKKRLGVLSILFDFIINNKKIPILNKGNNFLQFIHIDDLTNFIIKSINIKEKEIFNLASDEILTLKNLFLKLIKSIDSRSKIIQFKDIGITPILSFLNLIKLSPLNIYHIKMLKYSLILNNRKIKKKYKLKPQIKTSEMMIEALKSYKKNNNNYKNSTEITSPIKMKILRLIYYFF